MHLGIMMTSGLGKSDIENRAMIRGLFREMIDRVYAYHVTTQGENHDNVHLCRDGYYYEPSVAERVKLLLRYCWRASAEQGGIVI